MSNGVRPRPRSVTISNPMVPFETILNTVQPGLSVEVRGQRIEGKKIFFQFQTGSGENADIAFRFVPRWVYDPEVIGNSRIGGNWGDEDRFIVGSMPLGNTGDTFQLLFVIEENHFKVAINGSHFCTYPHRMNLYDIRYFRVENAVCILQVTIYNQTNSTVELEEVTPILNPRNDDNLRIPFENIKGHSTIIAGELLVRPEGGEVPVGDAACETPRPQHSRTFWHLGTAMPLVADRQFSLQFLDQSNPPDIYFSFNPNADQRIIDINSRHLGHWGENITVSEVFPFAQGQPFQIEIAVDQYCFRVFVNGAHLLDFQHRLQSLRNIKRIVFSGSVSIASVTFC